MQIFICSLIAAMLCLPLHASFAKTIATFEVAKSASPETYIPLSATPGSMTTPGTRVLLSGNNLNLYQVQGDKRVAIPFQLSKNQIHWLAESTDQALEFEWVLGRQTAKFTSLNEHTNNELLTIEYAGQKLLAYQFGHMAAPEGEDAAYGRSGFLHPVWSPKGQVLTHIQPKSHFHHYGIWNPWTHLNYQGREYDLWNLAKKQGRVRFAKFVRREHGPVFSEFTALHEHVIYPGVGKEIVIMEEEQTVRVYRPSGEAYYIMDMTMDFTASTDAAVTLLEYRYGGFGWRATEQWHQNNSEILSSEGKDRSEIDSTLGRWFYAQGEVDKETAGIQVMSHPANFNHPEPLRIWPASDKNRGAVFATFSATKNTDWVIEPGKRYVRRYRFFVYNGKLNKQNAESAWRVYAKPPAVKVGSTSQH